MGHTKFHRISVSLWGHLTIKGYMEMTHEISLPVLTCRKKSRKWQQCEKSGMHPQWNGIGWVLNGTTHATLATKRDGFLQRKATRTLHQQASKEIYWYSLAYVIRYYVFLCVSCNLHNQIISFINYLFISIWLIHEWNRYAFAFCWQVSFHLFIVLFTNRYS